MGTQINTDRGKSCTKSRITEIHSCRNLNTDIKTKGYTIFLIDKEFLQLDLHIPTDIRKLKIQS